MVKKYVLGIDIGGTFTKIGIVDREGMILKNTVYKTGSNGFFSDFLKKLEVEVSLLKSFMDDDDSLLAIGVGAPNANYLTGNMEHPVNFRWGEMVPLVTEIAKLFGLPVHIANDANAAALGELYFGSGRNMKDFVILTLGTGLGSGIIANGEILRGAHGMAGEIGHVNVDPQGRSCKCGLRGCLETYASVTGIKRTVFELLAEMTVDSPMRQLSFDEMTGEMIADAALEGDVIALAAFEKTASILGSKMADTAAHLDPEAFILSGGLSKAGDILLGPVLASMEKHLFKAYKGKIMVLISDLPGAGTVLGPAALAWQQIEGKDIKV
ncbi:MAG: ROK family protein [Flavobacteriaceae bacterium]